MKRYKDELVEIHVCTDCSREMEGEHQRARIKNPIREDECRACGKVKTGRALKRYVRVEV